MKLSLIRSGWKDAAGVGDVFAAEDAADDLDRLAHRRGWARVRNFQAAFDPVFQAGADAENCAAVGDFVERGEFHRGQRGMPRVRIDDAESNLDLRSAARDCRGERERAAPEGILGHPEGAEAEFFGAFGERDELARVRAFASHSEFANFRHLPCLRLLLVLECHPRAL